jgi:hypothetical protein
MQDSLDRRIKGKILFFKNKIEEIEAIEKYYERNFLFELATITRQKKRKIQQKLKDARDMYRVYFLLRLLML